MTAVATIQKRDVVAPPTQRPHLGVAGATRIGLVLMADEARRIEEGLNALSGNVQSLALKFERIDGKLDATITTKDDHEKRLRAVEQWKWQVVGASLALSLFVSSFVTYLLGQIK